MSLIEKRTRLPMTRPSVTHTGMIYDGKEDPFEFTVTIGLSPHDKRPREMFVETSRREQSYDEWATAVSLIWQMDPGSLAHTVKKFAHIRREPAGMTKEPGIGYAKSVYDYIMRWIALEFLDKDVAEACGVLRPKTKEE